MTAINLRAHRFHGDWRSGITCTPARSGVRAPGPVARRFGVHAVMDDRRLRYDRAMSKHAAREATLIRKIRSLPPERVAEVEA